MFYHYPLTHGSQVFNIRNRLRTRIDHPDFRVNFLRLCGRRTHSFRKINATASQLTTNRLQNALDTMSTTADFYRVDFGSLKKIFQYRVVTRCLSVPPCVHTSAALYDMRHDTHNVSPCLLCYVVGRGQLMRGEIKCPAPTQILPNPPPPNKRWEFEILSSTKGT